MKKLYLCLFALVLFVPNITKAVEIKDVTIVGKENITIGEPFTESFLVTFDNLERKYTQSIGVLYIKYEITFDDNLLTLTSIESPDWDTIIYQENDKYYVLSIVNTDNRLQKNCFNSFLYCGDYRTTIEFFPTTSTLTETTINLSNFELALIDMSTTSLEYTYDDIIIEQDSKNIDYPLIISNSETTNIEDTPENIITEISTNEIKQKIIEALKQEPIINNDSSNLLTEIKIQDYELDFNKYKNNYIITIPKDISTINFTITKEDDSATYKILDNENLIDGSKITIEVTSTDNKVNTYIINIKKDQDDISQNLNSTQKVSLKEVINKHHKYIKYAIFIISGILLIIIIIKIISKIKDKKIEDLTNNF